MCEIGKAGWPEMVPADEPKLDRRPASKMDRPATSKLMQGPAGNWHRPMPNSRHTRGPSAMDLLLSLHNNPPRRMNFEPLSPTQVGRLLGRRRSRMQQGRRSHFEVNDTPKNGQTARAKTASTQYSKVDQPGDSKMDPIGHPKMDAPVDPKMSRQTESKMDRRSFQKLTLVSA